MGLFQKKQTEEMQPMPERQVLQSKYASSRHNILLVLIFTTINLILLVANSNTYFLFSAFIPYVIVNVGMALSGRYPAEYYEDWAEFEKMDGSVLVITLVIAVVICLLYLLCWLFSDKGRVGWLITALVLFSLDTLLMLMGGLALDSVVDILFHAWVIISLSKGIAAHAKLKKLPEEEHFPTELL